MPEDAQEREPAAAGMGIYFVQRWTLLLFSFLESLGQLYQSEKSLTVQNAIPASVQPAPHGFEAISLPCALQTTGLLGCKWGC